MWEKRVWGVWGLQSLGTEALCLQLQLDLTAQTSFILDSFLRQLQLLELSVAVQSPQLTLHPTAEPSSTQVGMPLKALCNYEHSRPVYMFGRLLEDVHFSSATPHSAVHTPGPAREGTVPHLQSASATECISPNTAQRRTLVQHQRGAPRETKSKSLIFAGRCAAC